MPPELQRAKMMREQLGFALNRVGRDAEAEQILKAVITEFGPSSETNGLLGRIYKDRYESAKDQGRLEARAFLKRAIDTYLEGFEADWRDAYPGVNAVTLMNMMDRPDPRQAAVLPVVRYAASQKAKRNPDYWDYATLLELAILAGDSADAETQLTEALALARQPWEVESTERNLRLMRKIASGRGEDATWIQPFEEELTKKGQELTLPATRAS